MLFARNNHFMLVCDMKKTPHQNEDIRQSPMFRQRQEIYISSKSRMNAFRDRAKPLWVSLSNSPPSSQTP